MDQIIVLDISFGFLGVQESIHPVALQSGGVTALIDCGYPGFLPDIEKALQNAGLDPAGLTHIIITHHDFDHMGAAAAFLKKYPSIRIVAGEAEAPYISGEKKSLRLMQAEEMQKTLPPEKKEFGRRFYEIVAGVRPVPVDLTVSDGDVLDWCGGLRVVATPGHTPGHISLYLEKEKIMVTGDAAVLENGRLAIANPAFTLDRARAEQSLVKIANAGAKKIVCYHGGAFYPKNG